MASSGGPSRRYTVIFSRKCLFLDSPEQQGLLNVQLNELAKSAEINLHYTSYPTPLGYTPPSYPSPPVIPPPGCLPLPPVMPPPGWLPPPAVIPLPGCLPSPPVAPQTGNPSQFPVTIDQLPVTSFLDPPVFIHRRNLRNFIKERQDAGHVVVICGAENEDMYVAAQTKSLLIAPYWVPLEEKVIHYGVQALTPRKMRAILDIIVNQTSWYYSCYFNDPVPTKVFSLCSANTFPCFGVSQGEIAMANEFKAILKYGVNNPVIRQALLCHLMAAIAHDVDFREVQDWAVAPPSSTQPNQTMEGLKEYVRWMMYGRKPQPIFIRHTPTSKSRFDDGWQRQDPNYCQKHFRSIRVNEHYKGKLKGRVVCVFDDYLTNGNTFESLRNLLVACQVRKIIFVSIGKFRSSDENCYVQKSFTISGDVYTGCYDATFNGSVPHVASFNDAAPQSLENLEELAKHLI